MLVTAGISDPRVTYWEPAKYVARLRATRTDDNPLLLKTNMASGHFGQSGRYDALLRAGRAVRVHLCLPGHHEAGRVNSASMMISTASLTPIVDPGDGMPNAIPKAERSRLPFAEKPMREPEGSSEKAA